MMKKLMELKDIDYKIFTAPVRINTLSKLDSKTHLMHKTAYYIMFCAMNISKERVEEANALDNQQKFDLQTLKGAADTLYSLTPYMLFRPLANGKRATRRHQRNRCSLYLNGEFLQLLKEPVQPRTHRPHEEASDVEMLKCNGKKALEYIKANELSRAAQAIESFGINSDPEAVNVMKDKHPKGKAIDTSALQINEPQAYNFTDDQLELALRKLSRNTGQDALGWRTNHISIIKFATARPTGYPTNDQLIKQFRMVITTFVTNQLSNNMREDVKACLLYAMIKPPGNDRLKLRPVTVGATFCRLIGGLIMITHREKFQKDFEPIQFGVASKNGCEKVYHLITLLLEQDKNLAVLSTDIINAFNSICRQTMLEEVHQHYPELLPFVLMNYATPSTLHFRDNTGVSHSLSSEMGPRQGDSLGSFLFALTFHRVLKEIDAKFGPKITVLAYADNAYFVGPPDDLIEVYAFFKRKVEELDLTIKPEESFVFCHTKMEEEVTSQWAKSKVKVARSDEGLPILGCPYGSDNYIIRETTTKVRNFESRIAKLAHIPLVQGVYLLFRYCITTRVLYMLRCVKPTLLHAATTLNDNNIANAIADVMKTPPLTTYQYEAMCLPIQTAGLGFTKAAKVAPAAYLASWCSMAATNWDSIPAVRIAIDNLQATCPGTYGALMNSMMTITSPGVTEAMGLREDEVQSFDPSDLFKTKKFKNNKTGEVTSKPSSYSKNHGKAQHRLTKYIYSIIKDDLFGGGIPQDFAARMMSASDPTASLFLLARPSRWDQLILDREFRTIIAIRYGLGLNELVNLQPTQICYLCKNATDRLLMHLVRCKATNGNILRHDNITKLIVRFLTICGRHSKLEVTVFEDSMKRLDIVVSEPDHQVLIDVTMTDPTGTAIVAKAATTPHAALKRARQGKIDKYQPVIDNRQNPATMKLLVAGFETCGAWDEDFSEYFKSVARQAQQQDTSLSQSFTLEWSIKLSVALHREIAKSVHYKTQAVYQGDFDVYDASFDHTSPLNQVMPTTTKVVLASDSVPPTTTSDSNLLNDQGIPTR
jgi:hypothetical protein